MKFNEGQDEFWELVKCLKGESKRKIKGKGGNNIVFIDDLYNFYHVFDLMK